MVSIGMYSRPKISSVALILQSPTGPKHIIMNFPIMTSTLWVMFSTQLGPSLARPTAPYLFPTYQALSSRLPVELTQSHPLMERGSNPSSCCYKARLPQSLLVHSALKNNPCVPEWCVLSFSPNCGYV